MAFMYGGGQRKRVKRARRGWGRGGRWGRPQGEPPGFNPAEAMARAEANRAAGLKRLMG